MLSRENFVAECDWGGVLAFVDFFRDTVPRCNFVDVLLLEELEVASFLVVVNLHADEVGGLAIVLNLERFCDCLPEFSDSLACREP